MKAICVDGTHVDCESFETAKGGVTLTVDDDPVAFIPHHELRYVVPDAVFEERWGREAAPQRGQQWGQTQQGGYQQGGYQQYRTSSEME
ncbi:hypothetical protein ACFQH6_03040 [Halobacteriaceae archaeon GCM10025711]